MEYQRHLAHERRQRAGDLGQCQNCSKPAILGQARWFSCQLDAERAIKKRLAYSATFDEHVMETSIISKDRAIITGDGERGWNINTVMIFEVQNAFGVQSDYLVWYDAQVSPNGDCRGIRLGEFVPYVR